jgi:uncharacterized protein YndB with AHSA1/START domain
MSKAMIEPEATDRSTAAPVVRTVHVSCAPDRAFRLFTDRLTDWWPLQRFGLFEAETAGVWFEGERVVERSTSGEEGTWAEVLEWSPPSRFVMSWHPGHPASDATVVEVEFHADDDGTRVVLTHTGWERLGELAAEARATYAHGWLSVLEGYADLAGSAT